MASDRNCCGFNAGDSSGLSTFSGGAIVSIAVDAALAGASYGFKLKKTAAVSGGYCELPIATLTSAAGVTLRMRMRFFFRIATYPSANHHALGGFGNVTVQGNAAIELDTTGHFRARASTVVSAYSTAVLALNTTYEAWLDATITDLPSGVDPMTTIVSIYELDGTLVETITLNNTTSLGFGPYTVPTPRLGGNTTVSATIELHYGAWVWAANNVNATPTLPTGKYITARRITAQGASDGWTPSGAWQRLDEIPFDPGAGAGDEITSSSAVDTTYTHEAADALADYAARTIYAWKVYANCKGSGAQAVLLDGTEYAHTPPVSYSVGAQTGVALDWTERTPATFNTVEFGYRNKTGAALTLGGITSEIIHDLDTEADFLAADGQTSRPLTWMELTDRADTRHVFAEVDLNDPASYYGGYKRPWVVRFLAIARGLSDRVGQLEHVSFGALLSDTTRFFRGLLAGVQTRYLTNRPLVQRMIDDEDRRLQRTPRLAAVGYVAGYSPRRDLQFELVGTDWLKRKFSRSAQAAIAWQPVVTLEDFPHAADEYLTETQAKRSVNAVGQAIPLIYGQISDYHLVDQVVSDPGSPGVPGTPDLPGTPGTPGHTNVLPYDPNIEKVPSCFANNVADGLGSFGDEPVDVSFVVTAIVGGVEGPLAIFFGITTGDTFSVRVNFDGIPGADGYRVYLHDGVAYDPHGNPYDASAVRFQSHDNSTLDGDYGAQFGVLWHSWDDGNNYPDVVPATPGDPGTPGTPGSPGSPATSTVIQVDGGSGLYAPLYVGDYDLGGTIYRGALISRCACKQLVSAYVNGVAVDLTSDVDWLTPVNAATWAAAGFATDYTDINGRRYFLIYVKGAAGDLLAGVTSPPDGQYGITLNVKGIESVGDGSGTLLTTPASQALHFVNNFLAPDTPYQSGAYLTAASTTFPHVTDLPLVDADSFAQVDTATVERLSGGYESAGIVGAKNEQISALDVLARFFVSGDFEGFFNRKGQLAATIEPIAQTTGGTALTDVLNITDRSFEIVDDVAGEFYNILPYAHSQDYVGRSPEGWSVITETRSELSIDLYEQERTAPRFDLYFLRAETDQGAATIADVMARKQGRYRDPRRKATLELPFSGLSHDVGEVVALTHLEGIGADGWIDHDVRILRHEVEPTDGRVRLDCYDLETLFGLTGQWAEETTPDRDAASEEEKRVYLFWGTESPDVFYSDGAAIKSWS